MKAALLDVDGTLIDSGYQHALAWWQALRQQEIDIPIATLHRAVGMGGDKLIPHVLGEVGVDEDDVDVDKLQSAQAAIFSVHWPSLRRLPGAREFIRHAARAQWRVVLASSAGASELPVLRRVLDADKWLHDVTESSDVAQSKPAPDLVKVALRKAGVEPADAIFLGDSVWDVRAAVAADVPCVGVECGGTSEAELREAGAIAVYQDPAELLARWAASPFGG